ALQSGVPFAAGQIVRPETIEEGFARRDIASPASLAASLTAFLARAFRSSIVSAGDFSGGNIEGSLSNSLPISLIRPGFSGVGTADRAWPCGGMACGCSCRPSEGLAACGRPAPDA